MTAGTGELQVLTLIWLAHRSVLRKESDMGMLGKLSDARVQFDIDPQMLNQHLSVQLFALEEIAKILVNAEVPQKAIYYLAMADIIRAQPGFIPVVVTDRMAAIAEVTALRAFKLRDESYSVIADRLMTQHHISEEELEAADPITGGIVANFLRT